MMPANHPDTLEARLWALAKVLEKATPEECVTAWAAEWKRLETKQLTDEAEIAVKAIVKFARMLAAGNIMGDVAGYKEMVGKVIAAAVGSAG